MQRVTPRPSCKIDEHLFITHRSAIYGDLTLFPVKPEDTEAIKQLLSDQVPQVIPIPRRTRHTRMSSIASRMSAPTVEPYSSHISISGDDEDQLQYDLKVVLAILENIFQDPCSKYQCFTIKCGDSAKSGEDNVTVGFVILRQGYNGVCTNLNNFIICHHYSLDLSLPAGIWKNIFFYQNLKLIPLRMWLN